MNAVIGSGLVLGAAAVSAAFYRHRGRPYAREKEQASASPSSFRYVYRWIQVTTIVAGVGAFVSESSWWLDLHDNASLELIGAVLALLGLALFVWSKLTLGDNYSPCFDAFLPKDIVQRGPYRLIRHPIYTANIVLLTGLFLASGTAWIAAALLALTLAYVKSARDEERELTQRFAHYAEYVRRSGRFLPRF